MDDELPKSSTEGEILFQVKQQYNEDDIKAVEKVERRKLRTGKAMNIYMKLGMILGFCWLIVSTVGIILQTIPRLHGVLSFIILYLAAFAWIMLILPAIVCLFKVAFPGGSKRRKENQAEFTVTFTQDYLAFQSGLDEDRVSYQSLNKFLETETHFLVYVYPHATCIPIRKTCFVVGTPEDFSAFMREKYRTKDMKPSEKGL